MIVRCLKINNKITVSNHKHGYQHIRGKRKNYSTVVPFLSDNEVLIIKSYRHLVDSIQFEIPSGYIEDGETPMDAAIREFKEETGYNTNKILFVGEYTLDYSMFEQKGYIYAAYDLVKNNKQDLGIMEYIKTDTLTINQLKEMLFNGKILNASSIVAFYKSLDFHLNYKNKKWNGIVIEWTMINDDNNRVCELIK